MFSKSSRYRNLPESSPVNAQGERLRGKELRLTPPTPGRFLHTVHEGDRLDLLAFKYYDDPSPVTRQQIIDEINDTGADVYPLRLLRTFAWDQADKTAEAFTFEAPSAKLEWRLMIEELAARPGVLELQSLITAATVRIVYHSGALDQKAILDLIAKHGFNAPSEPATQSRIGAQIVIPPNRIG